MAELTSRTSGSTDSALWRTKSVPTLIGARVAIGGETPYPYLRHMGFTAIVDLRERQPTTGGEDELRAFRVFHAPLDDGVAPSAHQLAAICRTIDSYPSSFFYVHCFEGIGRAVTVGAAYLMWSRSWSSDEALGRVVDLRPAANPTTAQVEALHSFGQVLAHPGDRGALLTSAVPLTAVRASTRSDQQGQPRTAAGGTAPT